MCSAVANHKEGSMSVQPWSKLKVKMSRRAGGEVAAGAHGALDRVLQWETTPQRRQHEWPKRHVMMVLCSL
eukprot:scaffold23781_cov17-Tisochrysis_lutea.AAC.2